MIIIRKNSNKIPLDKYYTPPELAKYIVDKTKEIIGQENITEYIEPSAGAGVFLDYLDKPYLAYDIEPEDSRIIEQDFLELELNYKKGRCVIGNPPFGDRNTDLFKLFWLKSIKMSDYISFILPISQYDNDVNLYQFDLIYSENLGLHEYSNKKLHCCFNIYAKPNHSLNKKRNYKLKDITIKRHTRNTNEVYGKDFEYDLRICCWGDGSVGNVCSYEGEYAQEYCIKINNEDYKDRIIKVIKDTDWKELCPSVSSAYLSQWKLLKHIKEKIPELK